MLKKNYPLLKKNYHPVSVLLSLSKVFEKLLLAQMQSHIDVILSDHMSAFRAGFSCQHVLLAMVERWREAIKNKKTSWSSTTRPFKSIRLPPTPLLIAKLRAYSVTILLANDLCGRKQRVKKRK